MDEDLCDRARSAVTRGASRRSSARTSEMSVFAAIGASVAMASAMTPCTLTGSSLTARAP
ncbi:MAG: hypothetical protein U0414_22590 [Polyangiaceae bacterium]